MLNILIRMIREVFESCNMLSFKVKPVLKQKSSQIIFMNSLKFGLDILKLFFQIIKHYRIYYLLNRGYTSLVFDSLNHLSIQLHWYINILWKYTNIYVKQVSDRWRLIKLTENLFTFLLLFLSYFLLKARKSKISNMKSSIFLNVFDLKFLYSYNLNRYE